MSYIRYKIIKNKTYAYEVSAHWDKEKKQSRNVSKYLGPLDENTNEISSFLAKK